MNNIQRLQFRDAIVQLAPHTPANVLRQIVDREANRLMVARLDVNSFIPLALAALAGYIRHHMTQYNFYLAEKHLTRFQARTKVAGTVANVLNEWGVLQ